MKKYNEQTGNYKIDIFYNGMYKCSTDWSKTCKQAKERYFLLNSKLDKNLIKCTFFKY